MPYPTRQRTYVGLGAAVAFLVIAHYSGLSGPLERFLRSSTVPIFINLHGISIKVGENYQFFKNKEEFFQAYQLSVAANERQATLTADSKRLENENIELKKQLNYVEKNKPVFILAQVVGHDVSGINQTIIIDRGARDGSQIDVPVVTGNGILVGKVIKVEQDMSVVRLVNDNQSRVAGNVLSHDRSLGVIEGGFGISLQMNLIPRDEIIQVGDQVVTSGLEKNIPRGLLIGVVASVENEAYKPFQRAILTPATDLNKITVVSILIPRQEL